jgi:hypothetical protein
VLRADLIEEGRAVEGDLRWMTFRAVFSSAMPCAG